MSTTKERFLGADGYIWTEYKYTTHSIWQRKCPDCDGGVLTGPARFHKACHGSGYIATTTQPPRKEDE